MRHHLDELLLQLESRYPEIFDELHGWSARREYGDLKLQLARQNRFIMRHMPNILAQVNEHNVVDTDTIGTHHEQEKYPVVVIRQKEVIHGKGW